MRPSTKFFDINCAWSCDQCHMVNSTIRTDMPLPPILEPFDFILGHWTTDSNNEERFPVKFDSATKGFNQTLSFLIANVTMFNTPLLNYSCEAANIADPLDIQVNIGFMTLKPDGPDLYKAWIWSTANNGLTVIEEGWVKEGQLMLKSSMIYTTPASNLTIPKQV
uniref:THAP4-like heme-binding beta-barrel domain-containing protein n=1 Tax=Romanomermis culicivorax TaxID=13658 RepID=A0A915ICV4_ROMCU